MLGAVGVPDARELRIEQDEAGLDPQHIEGRHADRAQAEGPAGLEQRIPEVNRPSRIHPQLVPEVARVARSGHVDVGLGDRGRAAAEVLEVAPVLVCGVLEERARHRTLDREGSDLV